MPAHEEIEGWRSDFIASFPLFPANLIESELFVISFEPFWENKWRLLKIDGFYVICFDVNSESSAVRLTAWFVENVWNPDFWRSNNSITRYNDLVNV